MNQNKTWNGFPKTENCSRCGREFQVTTPSGLFCATCRVLQRRLYQKLYRDRTKAKVPAPIKLLAPIIKPDICWWCLSVCKPDENCPDCKRPYDLEKAMHTMSRQTNSYMDIVRKCAKAHGQDEQAEISKVVKQRSIRLTFGPVGFWKEMDTKLTEFLKTRKHKSYFNRDFNIQK